jgi:hypothetical protein
MMRNLASAIILVSAAIGTNVALAAPPPSVVGNWTVVGNQSNGVLVIRSQAATGACRQIGGTIYGNPIEGFYCPSTGRIHFVRKAAATNDTFQSWLGSVGEDGAAMDFMGGTFVVSMPAGGAFGQYNLSASRP